MYIEMKKIILTLLLLMCVSFQGQAVLKERDLNRTLHVLRLELHDKWIKQEESSKRIRERNQAQHTNLVNIMKRCQSTSLILYSQGREFTFDVAYACQQATTLYNELKSKTMPFDEIKANLVSEISRSAKSVATTASSFRSSVFHQPSIRRAPTNCIRLSRPSAMCEAAVSITTICPPSKLCRLTP